MHCTHCGAEINDDARFCTECGWSVPQRISVHETSEELRSVPSPSDISAAENAPEEEILSKASPDEAASEVEPSLSNNSGKSTSNRKRQMLTIAGVVLIVAVLGGTYFVRFMRNGAKSPDAVSEAPLEPQEISVVINAPGYTSEATRIPLHITGTDVNEPAVDTIEYVGPDDASIELKPGTYQIEVAASPILEDGTIYQLPDSPAELSVPSPGNETNDDIDEESTDSKGTSEDSADAETTSLSISLEPISDPLEVTTEQISAAKDAAVSDPDDDGKAERLSEVASSKQETIAERSRLAVEYVQASQTAQEPLPEDDMTIKPKDETAWKKSVFSYLEPGTASYYSVDKFGMLAVTIVRNPQVTEVHGNVYTVTYEEAGTQNPYPGWSKEFKTWTEKLTFNYNNRITREDIVY